MSNTSIAHTIVKTIQVTGYFSQQTQQWGIVSQGTELSEFIFRYSRNGQNQENALLYLISMFLGGLIKHSEGSKLSLVICGDYKRNKLTSDCMIDLCKEHDIQLKIRYPKKKFDPRAKILSTETLDEINETSEISPPHFYDLGPSEFNPKNQEVA